jgi:alpha-mannosidase
MLVLLFGGWNVAAEASEIKGTIHVIPQSHIDVAWLWRYDPETIHRCCRPTFSLALENMDRFPDYTFSQSQVPLYQAIEEAYPKLMERIKRYVAEGRWEIVGGMYVEFEGGEPCGESLVRQCVMGKRYFLEKFGVDVKTGWQEDAWSHPWQLPQILKKCGMDSYMFKRGGKGERLFWWQSPDGSRVLACNPLREGPSHSWMDFFTEMNRRYGVRDVMVEIGAGDHGGGPTPQEIEAVKRLAEELSDEVEVKFSTFEEFSKKVLTQGRDLPVIADELGFELLGDLTNCAEIKRKNRYCEALLLTTEKFCSLASILFGYPYPSEELYESWKKLLFNQFHDIIGGSGIPPVCRDALRFYEIIEESGEKLSSDSLSVILGNMNTDGDGIPIVVVNPVPWERTDIVEAEIRIPEGWEGIRILDQEKNEIPVQITEERVEGEEKLLGFIFVAESVPSLGFKTYWVAEGMASYPNPFLIEDFRISNEFFDLELDPETGLLKRVFDKRKGRDVLDPAGRGNMLVAIEDEGDSEGRFVKGSDTIARPPGRRSEILSKESIEICETGPVRAKVRIKRRFRSSSFVQEIVLYSRIERIDFLMGIDWHDVHWMIKLAFPLSLEDPVVTCETAYGSVVRPADGLEYPMQRWVDLSSGGYGVALLNDSRYGYDVEGRTVSISVLRSPTEPAYNTDEGHHLLRYSLYPHSGNWKEAGVMRRGYEFNYPLMAIVEGRHGGKLPSAFSAISVEPDNVIMEVLKKAYDTDDFVIRLYEVHGRGCEVSVRMPIEVESAYEADLMERKVKDVDFEGCVVRFPIGAYEIKTIVVKIKR